MDYCCPTTIFVQPVIGQKQINECIIDPGFNIPPPWVFDDPPEIQCPIQFPFSKFETYNYNNMNYNYVESCCKCPSQTICIPAGESNHFNEVGAEFMMQENEFIDKSKFVAFQFRYRNTSFQYDES